MSLINIIFYLIPWALVYLGGYQLQREKSRGWYETLRHPFFWISEELHGAIYTAFFALNGHICNEMYSISTYYNENNHLLLQLTINFLQFLALIIFSLENLSFPCLIRFCILVLQVFQAYQTIHLISWYIHLFQFIFHFAELFLSIVLYLLNKIRTRTDE